MSKTAIYEQLISENGDKFDEDAAKYAVDNLKVDFNDNALRAAQTYFDDMNMTKEEIFTQLSSKHGDKFTEAEAQYAIDNLK